MRQCKQRGGVAGLNVMADHLPSDFCRDSSLLCSVGAMLMLEQTGDLCFSSKESKPFSMAWQQSRRLQMYNKAEFKKRIVEVILASVSSPAALVIARPES